MGRRVREGGRSEGGKNRPEREREREKEAHVSLGHARSARTEHKEVAARAANAPTHVPSRSSDAPIAELNAGSSSPIAFTRICATIFRTK